MENDPGGRERLTQLGMRNVPVVAKGAQFVPAKRMDVLAKFVGVQLANHVPLAPDVLIIRWVKILRAAQRYVSQLPAERLSLPATHNRGRPVRVLCRHIFNVGDVFLKSAAGHAKGPSSLASAPLAEGSLSSVDEISGYGDQVITRLEQWWKGRADKSCREQVEITNYGVLSIHQLLERCTWHSAHHTRQVTDVLQREGIEPDGKFNEEYLAGLPLPKRTWD